MACLPGGLGADHFEFRPVLVVNVSTFVNLGTDTIADFKEGVDKIVLGSDITISNVAEG